MHSQPLVSIPIITYNGEKYLEEQLDSIYSQTYKNIEVLAFDDNSSDNTKNILENYHQSHGLKYTVNQNNIGFQKNAAQSIAACNGDFIAPADQDDIWKSHKIETLINSIGDNVLIYTDSAPILEDGTQISSHFFQVDKNMIEGNHNLAFLLNNCVAAHAMLFKKELLDYILPIPEGIIFHDWWIAFVASTYGSIKYLDEPLNYYRRHDTQVTVNNKENSHINFWEHLVKKDHLKIQENINTIKRLQAFSTLQILSKDTKELITNLISLFQKFSYSYKNNELKQLLLEHAEEIFMIHTQKDYKRLCRKLSRGIWYYRFKLYT